MLLEAALALEIQNTNPKVKADDAAVYAHEVVDHADRTGIDPWVFHGLIFVESRWTAKVVRKEWDGTCSVGLGQINVKNCQSPRVKELQDPLANLEAMADFLSRIKEGCKYRCTGIRWLWTYNSGNPIYVDLVKKVVDRSHALYDDHTWALPEVQTPMHFRWMRRREDT